MNFPVITNVPPDWESCKWFNVAMTRSVKQLQWALA